jgi:anti-sigma factor RsiW
MSVVTCYLVRRRLGAFVDGGLPEAVAASTAAHVARCARCQREVESLHRLQGLLRAALTPADPDWTGFWQGIVRGIENARQPVPAVRRWAGLGRRWAFGSVAIATALLVSLTIWQLLPGRPREAEAQVVVRSADSPGRSVMVYSTPDQDMTVVWVFGLD